jgi:hypothetical protein
MTAVVQNLSVSPGDVLTKLTKPAGHVHMLLLARIRTELIFGVDHEGPAVRVAFPKIASRGCALSNGHTSQSCTMVMPARGGSDSV